MDANLPFLLASTPALPGPSGTTFPWLSLIVLLPAAVALVMLVIAFVLLLFINALQSWQRHRSWAPV